ncbi:CoA transferase [Streptomyces sp. SID8361]|uniref:CaiB/BaiF CoA transferase family protein n=1 Tax=Streptomyces sp. MnatMP-M27 TaxID=1839768 RepID=UPI00081F7215|nr:CaiB/BaiF CoA-transferase family protein [Streptomyces sp. MnatMP-M27]MYU16111.1 CoA transferase [Streptomyces sp. SID8361]SCG10670.1 Crotonobetainyl-CoA:carnitine CoA-transferase CaiB [Streptomyces sp. MnatMP-M27]
MTGPLTHVKVLDLSRIMAGPWAGQVLADLGADVVKVERPGTGDDTRSWGPPFLGSESGYFLSVNRGKRSVTADIATAEGQELVRRLAATSDIVLENFKAGTLERYGLGYEDLRAVKPDIIYCSITGFGQTGPRRDQAAYDFMIQAMGGLMSVTGEPDDRPGGGPQKVGIPVVDLFTGMYAATGVLAALAHRDRTGEGDHIDLAMLDVQVGILANQAMNHLISGEVPVRRGNRHPNIQPQDVYPCRDGHLVVAVGNDGQFVHFCEALGMPELASDPDYATNEARVRNVDALTSRIRETLADGDLAHWLHELGSRSVPCGPINTVPMAFADEQVRHRDMVRQLPHPTLGSVPQIVSPLRFRNAALDFTAAPPLLGEHDAETSGEFAAGARP